MRHTLLAPLALIVLAPTVASADALDDESVLVGLEHVSGVAFGHVEASANGQTATTSTTEVTLLWAQGGAVYGSPRLGFDGIVAKHLTLGGAIGYWTHSSSVDQGNGAVDQPSVNIFAVAPRLGALVAATPNVYFWPRLGMTYFRQSQDGSTVTGVRGASNVTHGESIDLDPALAIFPVQHFGLLFDVDVSIPVGGGESEQITPSLPAVDVDVKYRSIGFFVGVVGAL